MRKSTRSLFHGVAIECWGGLLQGEDRVEKYLLWADPEDFPGVTLEGNVPEWAKVLPQSRQY